MPLLNNTNGQVLIGQNLNTDMKAPKYLWLSMAS